MNRVDVALGLFQRGGRYFLQRRDPAAAILPGLWEFPGGKLDAGEAAEAALRRELREELGVEALACEALECSTHAYPDREVCLHPFLCTREGDPRTALAWGWFTLEEIRRLPVPEANGPIVELLVQIAIRNSQIEI